MKQKVLLIFFVLGMLTSSSLDAQKNQVNVSGSVYFPLAIPGGEDSKGYGISLSRQHFFSEQWSFDLNTGYIYFSGEFVDWHGDKQNHFALIPVSIGARYYLHNFFAGLHTGFAIKASSNAGTNLLFSPFIGYRTNKFQFSAKLLGIPQTFATYPEKTFFQKGGYSYLGFGVDYRFK